MTFKLSTKPEEISKWPVKVHRPDPKKPGKFEVKTFHATFVIMGEKEFDEINRDSNLSDVQRLRKVMTGWDIQDETGKEYDFNDDAVVEAVLNVPYITPAIYNTYRNLVSGGAIGKNF